MNVVLEFLRWWIPWEPSLTVVVVFTLAVWLYARGARRSPVTAPRHRQWLFWAGLAMLYVGLHTRLDYYAEHQFFVSRLQQLGLQHVAPFLLVLAYPVATLRRGLPFGLRTRWMRALRQDTFARRAIRFITHPWVACLLFVGVMAFWLLPRVMFYTMLDWRLYRLMNWSMVGVGVVYWWLILDPRPTPPARMAPGMRVLVEMLVMVPLIVIGAYITFVDHDLYPIFSLCGRAFLGMPALTDQYMGGLIIWIPSSMMSVAAALIAFNHWIGLDSRGRLPRNQRQRALRARATQPLGPAALAGSTEKST